MPTIQSEIEAALFARIASFVHSPAIPVAWPNVSMNPKPARYLRVNHIPNTSRRLFVGSGAPHQRLGLLQVDVFTELNQGPSTATEIAGLIAAHFPADLRLTTGSPLKIVGRVTKAADVGPAMPDDTHWMVPTTIYYEALR